MLELTFDSTVLLTVFIKTTGLFFGETRNAREEKGRDEDNISGKAEYYFLFFLTSIMFY